MRATSSSSTGTLGIGFVSRVPHLVPSKVRCHSEGFSAEIALEFGGQRIVQEILIYPPRNDNYQLTFQVQLANSLWVVSFFAGEPANWQKAARIGIFFNLVV